jgi:hypothetical protein
MIGFLVSVFQCYPCFFDEKIPVALVQRLMGLWFEIQEMGLEFPPETFDLA